MQVSKATARVLLIAIHIGCHVGRAIDRVLLQRNTIGHAGAWETMVWVVEVQLVVVRSVLDDLEGEADTLGLACDHVVR